MRKYSVLIATISALLLALISTPAHGNGVTTVGCGGGGTFTITSGVVSEGSSCAGAAVIPDGVTSIGEYAFEEATSLTSITFDGTSTLTSIGDGAFASATSLTSITIPASVTSIGEGAFDSATALTSITFAGTSTLALIGQVAFRGATSLTSITIPASVTSIGRYAFHDTTSLTTITVAEGNPNYSSLDGVLFNLGKTSLIRYPIGKSQASYPFPASVTAIGEYAFNEATSLTSITIPASVTSIGISAFYRATALTSITFDSTSTLTSIGISAFRETSLTSITIPAGVTSIGGSAFNGATSLTSVYFSGNAPTAATGAFVNVATGAKAYIKTGATGFAAIDSVWNNLTVAIGVYNVTYDSSGGSVVASGAFIKDGAISQASTQPTKSGYTFTGWSATDGGTAIVFPYTPPTPSADITLFAKWASDVVPAPVSDPEVTTPADPLVSTPAPAIMTAKRASKSIQFSAGSRVLTKAHKSALTKSIKKSGLEATYVVMGTAGKLPGVTNEQVKRLAKLRANAIKAYLVKRGVNESNISIKIKITNQGIVPKTNILAKYLVP